MNELGAILDGLEIPGSKEPPEGLLAAANEQSVAGGVQRTSSRWRRLLALGGVVLIGVPAGYAIARSGDERSVADLNPLSLAIETGGPLPMPTLPILQACLDVRAQEKPVPSFCEQQFNRRADIESGAPAAYTALGLASISIALKRTNGEYGPP